MNAMIMPHSGIRVRSQSRRRFIVARQSEGEVRIMKRSDSPAVAIAEADKIAARVHGNGGEVAVFDSVSGEVVKAWMVGSR